MAAVSRVVFRAEPKVPNLQQAVRNLDYGTPMDEDDITTIKAALQNILDFFILALKEATKKGSAFLTCFKNGASWPIVLVILRRCEAVIKYCLGHEGMHHVQQSLGTLRFVKGGQPPRSKNSCEMIGAQAEKTIWLYKAWWKSHSLRSPNGVKPEKGHNGRVSDALAEAFMASQEGTLFHEVVHLASAGQMKRLLSLAYPRDKVPFQLAHGKDMVGDTVIHHHVNVKLHSDQIIDAKYGRPSKGTGIAWQGAYHLAGVRDLASLERGKLASILNADSYNAFAALALLRRVEADLTNQLDSVFNVSIPHLHPDAVSRLRKAMSMRHGTTQREPQNAEVNDVRKPSPSHISDLGSWPTLAELAATKLTKSDLRHR